MSHFEPDNKNPYRTPSSRKSPKNRKRFYSLILGHRMMMIAVLVHFLGLACFVIAAVNDTTPPDEPVKDLPMMGVVGFVILFLAGVTASAASWKLGNGALSPTAKYLYTALAWLPIPLLTILLMWQCISKANVVLEDAGIEVGLLGPRT